MEEIWTGKKQPNFWAIYSFKENWRANTTPPKLHLTSDAAKVKKSVLILYNSYQKIKVRAELKKASLYSTRSRVARRTTTVEMVWPLRAKGITLLRQWKHTNKSFTKNRGKWVYMWRVPRTEILLTSLKIQRH